MSIPYPVSYRFYRSMSTNQQQNPNVKSHYDQYGPNYNYLKTKRSFPHSSNAGPTGASSEAPAHGTASLGQDFQCKISAENGCAVLGQAASSQVPESLSIPGVNLQSTNYVSTDTPYSVRTHGYGLRSNHQHDTRVSEATQRVTSDQMVSQTQIPVTSDTPNNINTTDDNKQKESTKDVNEKESLVPNTKIVTRMRAKQSGIHKIPDHTDNENLLQRADEQDAVEYSDDEESPNDVNEDTNDEEGNGDDDDDGNDDDDDDDNDDDDDDNESECDDEEEGNDDGNGDISQDFPRSSEASHSEILSEEAKPPNGRSQPPNGPTRGTTVGSTGDATTGTGNTEKYTNDTKMSRDQQHHQQQLVNPAPLAFRGSDASLNGITHPYNNPLFQYQNLHHNNLPESHGISTPITYGQLAGTTVSGTPFNGQEQYASAGGVSMNGNGNGYMYSVQPHAIQPYVQHHVPYQAPYQAHYQAHYQSHYQPPYQPHQQFRQQSPYHQDSYQASSQTSVASLPQGAVSQQATSVQADSSYDVPQTAYMYNGYGYPLVRSDSSHGYGYSTPEGIQSVRNKNKQLCISFVDPFGPT